MGWIGQVDVTIGTSSAIEMLMIPQASSDRILKMPSAIKLSQLLSCW